jgi:hypothetical protein
VDFWNTHTTTKVRLKLFFFSHKQSEIGIKQHQQKQNEPTNTGTSHKQTHKKECNLFTISRRKRGIEMRGERGGEEHPSEDTTAGTITSRERLKIKKNKKRRS